MKYNSRKIERLLADPENSPVYIISEIGINHNGSLDKALQLIAAAKDAGADAVKFQKRKLENIYSKSVLEDANNSEWTFDYLIPVLKDCELSEKDYRKIKETCSKLDLDLIVTPFDEDSASFVASLNVAAFKIASADMTNLNLIRKCASYGQPLFISTGMWSESDIINCVGIFKKENIHFALLHAQSSYPAPYQNLNMGFIKRLKEISGLVGYSGHERGTFIPIAAVALGSRIIEKHITFDKNDKGPDHKASMLPDEWKQMIMDIRHLEMALGVNKSITQAEVLNKEAFAKSAVAVKFLKKGHVFQTADIGFKSPGKGIFPHEVEQYYGRVLLRDVPQDRYISKYDFEDELLIQDWKKFAFRKKWGVKCRFHDFKEYSVINSPVVEFHCSETDYDVNFREGSQNHELIVHAPEIFNRELVDICSEDKNKTERSLVIIQKAINKTLEISRNFPKSKPKLVLHLGGMFLDRHRMDDTQHIMSIAADNFKKLKYSPDEIELLPENLPPRPWYLGGEWYQHGFMTEKDMLDFCNHFKLGITLDICHAWLYCNFNNKKLTDYIKAVQPIIRHVHISDAAGTNGEGLQIGEGEIDFDSIMSALKDIKFSWLPEIWCGHLHRGTGVYKALNLLEKYEGTL